MDKDDGTIHILGPTEEETAFFVPEVEIEHLGSFGCCSCGSSLSSMVFSLEF